MEFVGSAVFVVDGCILEVVVAGLPPNNPEDSGAAVASEGALVAAVPAVLSVGFSDDFSRSANILLAEAGAGAAEAPVSEFDAPKRLGAAVVGVLDSADFEVNEGRLKAAFGASVDCDVLGNIGRPPACALELGAADRPPRLGNMGFEASVLDGCASEVVGVVEAFASFDLSRLLKRPAVGCASGLFPKMFEPELFDAAAAKMLVAGCEVEVFAFESAGWLI